MPVVLVSKNTGLVSHGLLSVSWQILSPSGPETRETNQTPEMSEVVRGGKCLGYF